MQTVGRLVGGIVSATAALAGFSLIASHLATAEPAPVAVATAPASARSAPTAPATDVATCDRPAPSSARGWAAAFGHVAGGWLAGDNAASVPLPDGRVAWLFGDTLVATPSGGRTMVPVARAGTALRLSIRERRTPRRVQRDDRPGRHDDVVARAPSNATASAYLGYGHPGVDLAQGTRHC